MKILEGAYDIHVHPAPDVIPRKMDDLALAESYREAGMRGFVIKSHHFVTAGRAYLLRRLFPELDVTGAIVLNRSVGGLNPEAVRQAAKYGARLVFMPTLDAANMFTQQNADAPNTLEEGFQGIRILQNSCITEPVEEIMEIIKEYDLVLCSGHISTKETLALFERAKEKGVRKMIATHVEWPPTKATIEEQKRITEYGAYLEHCIINILGGDLSIPELIDQVREIGAEHMILSTDLGQAVNPPPAECFEYYAGQLLAQGLTTEELRIMICGNPEKLLGID